MFQCLTQHAQTNHSENKTPILTTNQSHPKSNISAAVNVQENNFIPIASPPCLEKSRAHKQRKGLAEDLLNMSKIKTSDIRKYTRLVDKPELNNKGVVKDLPNISSKVNTTDRMAAKPVPSSTATGQTVNLNGSKTQALNPQYSYKSLALAKSTAEAGDLNRVNIIAVVYEVLKVRNLFVFIVKF